MSYIGRQLNLPASTVQLTANNAITAGKPCVIQTDGDVAQVQTGLTGDPSVGTAVVWKSQDQSTTKAIAYDTNAQKLVIAYRDTSNNYGYAVVATISANETLLTRKIGLVLYMTPMLIGLLYFIETTLVVMERPLSEQYRELQ